MKPRGLFLFVTRRSPTVAALIRDASVSERLPFWNEIRRSEN